MSGFYGKAAPDGRPARFPRAHTGNARGSAGRARGASRFEAARRRHRSGGQYPARHRDAEGADRHEPRARTARDSRRRKIDRDRRLGAADRTGRASGHRPALSGAGAGRGPYRRPDPAQHGHGRRQSLSRHPLHLLQSKRMVAQRQRPLPENHRHGLPRGAEKPRRLLCHLFGRSRARIAHARRRGRHRRPARPPQHPAGKALYRLRAPGRPDHRDAGRRQVLSVAAAW